MTCRYCRNKLNCKIFMNLNSLYFASTINDDIFNTLCNSISNICVNYFQSEPIKEKDSIGLS